MLSSTKPDVVRLSSPFARVTVAELVRALFQYQRFLRWFRFPFEPPTRSHARSLTRPGCSQAEHLTMIDSKLFQAIKASDLLGCQWQKDASSPLSIISTVRE